MFPFQASGSRGCGRRASLLQRLLVLRYEVAGFCLPSRSKLFAFPVASKEESSRNCGCGTLLLQCRASHFVQANKALCCCTFGHRKSFKPDAKLLASRLRFVTQVPGFCCV